VEWAGYLTAAVAGYLLGSIPTGYLAGRIRGVDIRAAGSGNIGATNALRVLGKPAGIAVLAVDLLKGLAACWLAAPSVDRAFFQHAQPAVGAREWLAVVCGVCAILGHNYTCWLRFKGGKGVATTGGVFLALAPAATLATVACWIAVAVSTRYVSVASLAAAVALPLWVGWFGGSTVLVGIAAGAGLMAIVKHRANIRRLRAGTEHRWGAPRSRPPPQEAP